MLVIVLAGAWPTSSNTEQKRLRESAVSQKSSRSVAEPLAYRSPGGSHKLVLASNDKEMEARILASGVRRFRRYGSYTIAEVNDTALASLNAAALARISLRDDLNLLMLRRGQIDTTGAEPQIEDDLKQEESHTSSLHLVQLFGPPTRDAIRSIKATGARIISYIPNNAYLVWAASDARERIGRLAANSDPIQWEGPYHPAYKLAPQFKLDSVEQISVSIEIVDAQDSSQAISDIKSIARRILMPEFEVEGTLHLKALIESFRLKDIARLPGVIVVEPWAEPRLHDERANQIVAGEMTEETINNVLVSRPTRPGYAAFLSSIGLSSSFDFVVDVTDTGFDLGSTDVSRLHPDFLDSIGFSRIAYLNDFTQDFNLHASSAILPTHDSNGHGTINASIIGGFPNRSGSPIADGLGFQYGMGIAPLARIGVTKVFDDAGRFATGVTMPDFISSAYRRGARISNNSWGQCSPLNSFCNLYTSDSRVYDLLVRDADPAASGNQEMTIVFSSGNDGGDFPQSVSMPATAKNVITVGASEGFRAKGDNGQDLEDGCGLGSVDADNANDVIDFSSGGPVQDGRAKPDLVAPGTRITGAATQDAFYPNVLLEDIGTCDYFFPAGQTLYTWSSGTSHAAPLVSGAAALAYQWLRNRLGAEPSPAMVKAFILNSTRYLTGRFGGDTLPGARQGWGLLNLSRMFDQTDRVIYDQSPSRTFTESGGNPFEITGTITDPSKEFRVMLVWTDAPGSATTNATYVNQLDLEVIIGGVLYRGNHFSGQYSVAGGAADIINNVQGIRLPAGTTGPFVVRVRPAIIAGNGVPGNSQDLDQDFALVVTNAREAAVPVLAVNEFEGVTAGIGVFHSNGTNDMALIPGEAAGIQVTVHNKALTASATITSASLTQPGGSSAFASYPVIAAGNPGINTQPFQMSIPSNLRCGSIVEFELRLATSVGQFNLPVRVRVGREGTHQIALNDDVDSNRVKWKRKKGFSFATGIGTSGTRSYHAVDPGRAVDNNQLSELLLKKSVSIPANAGEVRLSFFHIFNFEPGFDGGTLEISTDNGKTWQDLGSRVIAGGYDGQVTEASENPLGTRLCWTARGRAGVFSQVVVNLDDFAGNKIKLRFRAGFDSTSGVRDGYTGWFIDDIQLTYAPFACR